MWHCKKKVWLAVIYGHKWLVKTEIECLGSGFRFGLHCFSAEGPCTCHVSSLHFSHLWNGSTFLSALLCWSNEIRNVKGFAHEPHEGVEQIRPTQGGVSVALALKAEIQGQEVQLLTNWIMFLSNMREKKKTWTKRHEIENQLPTGTMQALKYGPFVLSTGIWSGHSHNQAQNPSGQSGLMGRWGHVVSKGWRPGLILSSQSPFFSQPIWMSSLDDIPPKL